MEVEKGTGLWHREVGEVAEQPADAGNLGEAGRPTRPGARDSASTACRDAATVKSRCQVVSFRSRGTTGAGHRFDRRTRALPLCAKSVSRRARVLYLHQRSVYASVPRPNRRGRGTRSPQGGLVTVDARVGTSAM